MKKKRQNRQRRERGGNGAKRQKAWVTGGARYEESVLPAIQDTNAVSADTIAACSGLAAKTIDQLMKRGILRQSTAGLYNLYETMQAICNYIKQGDAFSSMATKRERKINEEIRKIQLQNDLEEGKLIPMENAQQVVAEICAIVRMGHEALGGRLANELAGIDEPAKIRQVLQRESRAIDKDAADKMKNLAVVRDDGSQDDQEEEEQFPEQKRA